MSELDRLDPEPRTVKLSTGFEVELQRLRTRQFFRLLKVLTHGAGPLVLQSGLDFREDPEQFGQKLISLIILAVPDAENEFIQFLASMTEPAGLAKGRKLTKQEEEDNRALWDLFNTEMGNPELDDLVTLIEDIVRQEAPEIQALGKRLAAAMQVFQKTGQNKDTEPETPPDPEELSSSSQARSRRRSTSSPASTDGTTSTSSASPSAGSGSA